MMNSSNYSDDAPVIFYVGHHETERGYAITDEIVHHAQDYNFDFLTSPITNDHFHGQVLTILSSHPAFAIDPAPSNAENSQKRPNSQQPAPNLPPLTPFDTTLAPSDTISQIILVTSPWIDLASSDPIIASISHQVLLLEVAYAAFCGASNILLQGPKTRLGNVPNDRLSQYARSVQDAMKAAPFVQFHISLPMIEEISSEPQDGMCDLSRFARDAESFERPHGEVKLEPELFGSWNAWDFVRSSCKYNSRLSIALTLPHRLPDISLQLRWFSEPLRILNFPESAFHRNAHGRPSLTKTQQSLITRYMRLSFRPWILLTDIGPLPDLDFEQSLGGPHSTKKQQAQQMASATDPTPAEASQVKAKSPPKPRPCVHYLEYIRVLQKRQPPRPTIERFGAGYQDYLQSPLQPLTDNLESITYETFEKDPVKYDWYENAIAAALSDWAKLGKSASGPSGRVVVVVVGAGRGPLITRSLQASEKTGVPIDMWAVEKNPNAFVLLQRHNLQKWNDRVTLVQSDMRSWPGPAYYFSDSTNSLAPSTTSSHTIPEDAAQNGSIRRARIDIMVSELLGSFGDNELSPECLDGIQPLLNPQHGISIPASYTAHLTPIATPKLYANVSSRLNHGDNDAASIPYVVMLQAIDYLSVQDSLQAPRPADEPQSSPVLPVIQEAWAFSHPTSSTSMRENNAHNRRFSRLEFKCKNRGVCHGIAGYFETVLYESTSPIVQEQPTVPDAMESGNGIEVEGTAKPNEAPTQAGEGSGTLGEPAAKQDPAKSSSKIELSTNPLTMAAKSEDMISWFPIFFPLKTPLSFPDNSILAVSMWRQTDGRKVWYEWLVESFLEHLGKNKVRLGMSELHSSEKNACLM